MMRKDKQKIGLISFGCLFLLGVLFGCYFSHQQNLLPLRNVPLGKSMDLSGTLTEMFLFFLFDHVFWLLFMFLFGLTFLGALVIPGVIFSKGIVQGITFTAAFAAVGSWSYVRICSMHLFGAFCTVLLFYFAVRSFILSINFCRQLYGAKGVQINWAQYGVYFIGTLAIFVAFGCVYSLTGYLLFEFL